MIHTNLDHLISVDLPCLQAICQTLEETVSDLQDRLREKEGEVAVLRTQVNFLMVQQKTLVKALRWADAFLSCII